MCKKIGYMFLFANLLCSAAFLVSCGKNKVLTKEESDAVDKKIAADRAHEEAHKSRPPIDPSLCKDNPEGYLYFKVGDELFRVNKDSPLTIAGVFPELDQHDQPIPNTTSIPKGCKQNPLKAGNNRDFNFGENFKAGRDDVVRQLEALRFEIVEVPDGYSKDLTYSIYSMEGFKWEDRYVGYREQQYGERGDFICKDAAENLAHCEKKSLGAEFLNKKTGLYVSNSTIYSNIQKLPLVLMCEPAIPEVKCSTFYRLYPTVNLNYSINYTNPATFDPKVFLSIDKYFRDMYESMRVKK